jgi:hypothetical protein
VHVHVSVQHKFGPSCSVILVAVRKLLVCFNLRSKKIGPRIINHPDKLCLRSPLLVNTVVLLSHNDIATIVQAIKGQMKRSHLK